MQTPFYAIVAADPAVQQLLGTPPRLYTWGENTDEQRQYPYVTFQLLPGGSPEAVLAGRSKVDECTLQIDIWAKTAADARAVLDAVRYAVEPRCRITSWRGESRDPGANIHRTGFDCRWTVLRP